MAPPKFGDIGKAANDLFNDDFSAGGVKLTLKSKAANGVEFKVEGNRNNDSGAVDALLETKADVAPGFTVKEKWTTKNVVTTELTATNQLVAGSKVVAESTFSPNGGGIKDIKVKAEYKNDATFFDTAVTASSVTAASVFGYGKYFFGASGTFNISKSALTANKVSVSYNESDLVISTSIANGSDVEGSVFHVPRAGIQTGVKFSWNKASKETGFAVVGKYALDGDAFVKAKIDTGLNLGLGYSQSLRKGVKLGLFAKINAGALASDSHSLGLSLSLDN